MFVSVSFRSLVPFLMALPRGKTTPCFLGSQYSYESWSLGIF